MAKVTGPLMSMDASGKFGGAMVFSKWNGRNTVHKLVTPSNPNTSGQIESRNDVRTLGEIQKFVKSTFLKYPGAMKTDLDLLKASTPAGQAWNGYLVRATVGAGALTIRDSDAAFAALTAPQKAAYDDAAADLVPAISDVLQVQPNGAPSTIKTAGNVYFNYLYGRASALKSPLPGAVPPAYV